MKNTMLLLAAAAMFAFASCSQPTAQQEEQTTDTETTFTHHETQGSMPVASNQETFKPKMTEVGLEKELVCMVNNAFMGKKQFPVEFEDKMYYGCCEMCVNTIQNDKSVRYAKDPVSGKEVDKSAAFIAMEPGHPYGGVLYFETEANYKTYMSKL